MEVKPITVYVHDEIHPAILRNVPEAELNAFYDEALWKALHSPFIEVIAIPFFDYSRSVPVRFTPSLPTYRKWCRVPKEFVDGVMNAFYPEVLDLLIEYECGLRGGK